MTTLLSSVAATRRYRSSFLLIALTAFTVISGAFTVINVNTDFSGEWKFNEQKSKLAEGRQRRAAQTIKVTRDGDAFSIERTSNSPNGQTFTSTEKITFDGKPVESTVFGNSKKTSTGAWSADGKSMTINSTVVFERDGNKFEVKVTEVWKLADDGKSLTIESTATSQQGTATNTFAYDKAA